MKHNFQKAFVAGLSALGLAMFMASSDDSSPHAADPVVDPSAGLEEQPQSGVNQPETPADQFPAENPDPSENTVPAESSESGEIADPAPTSSEIAEISSSSEEVSSSSEEKPASSETVPAEPSYAFGYALKNAPTPSKGCGRETTLKTDKLVENGEHHVVNVNGTYREYFITLPKNYDNTKPYKLLIALHCYGSSAEDFVHHTPDYDHPTPYYSQQAQDTEGNYMFASLQAVNGLWNQGQADHDFFGQALTTIEDNYCIDTSRVFITGFSFGAMFSYSLMQDYQERIRAAATYAVADYNIWLPQDAGTDKNLPVAWMNVHGQNDDRCLYDKAKNSALPRILKKNGKASDGDSQFTDASGEIMAENQGSTGHTCHDFATVDERFPVKFCSWPGNHQWTAHDTGNMGIGWGWEDTWVPEEVHKFFEQF